jgi:hypothetical protein
VSKSKPNEELLLDFIRYVSILPADDSKRTHG